MSDENNSAASRCPQCRAPLDAGFCIACGHDARKSAGDVADPAVSGGSPFRPGEQVTPPRVVSPFEYVPVRFQFSLGSALMLTTLAAILLSIGTMNWGLGIFLALLAFPALLRTSVTAMWRRAAGYPMTPGETTGLFFTSAIAILLIGAAFAATFFGTCFVSFMLGAGLGESASVPGMIIGLFGGLGLSIYVLVKSILFALRTGKEEQIRRMEYLRDHSAEIGQSPFPPELS